jgi:hypothetical protein
MPAWRHDQDPRGECLVLVVADPTRAGALIAEVVRGPEPSTAVPVSASGRTSSAGPRYQTAPPSRRKIWLTPEAAAERLFDEIAGD